MVRLLIVFIFFCRVRMISLAAQKFISDIANDALQHCKMRGSGQSSRKSGKVCSSFLSMLGKHAYGIKPYMYTKAILKYNLWILSCIISKGGERKYDLLLWGHQRIYKAQYFVYKLFDGWRIKFQMGPKSIWWMRTLRYKVLYFRRGENLISK